VSIVCNVAILSEYLKRVYSASKCVDSDSGTMTKSNDYFEFVFISSAPPSEITRTAVD
jgi:hypothetical protein